MIIREYLKKSPFTLRYPPGAHTKKLYESKQRMVTRLQIEDLFDIIGVEATCKLMSVFEACVMHVPSKRKFRLRVKHALIRYEVIKEVNSGGKLNGKFIYKLAAKYKFSHQNIKSILGKNYAHPSLYNKLRIDMGVKLTEDKKLLWLVQTYSEIFKQYDLL